VTIAPAAPADRSGTTLAAGTAADGCADFADAFSSLASTIGLGGDEVDQDALDRFNAAVDHAPDDLQDDLRLYRDTFQQYAEGLQAAGVDPSSSAIDPDDAARVAELVDLFRADDFVAASQAINDYISSNCSAG
jgi:hypothetical protein